MSSDDVKVYSTDSSVDTYGSPCDTTSRSLHTNNINNTTERNKGFKEFARVYWEKSAYEAEHRMVALYRPSQRYCERSGSGRR